MKLGFPMALWFFLILPLFLFLIVTEVRSRKKRMSLFSHPASWSILSRDVRFDLAKRRVILVFLGLFFAIIAATRPQWGETIQETKTTGMDILFALDLSRSMDAEDIAPDRLRKAKHIIRTITDELDGDRVGLIGFAGVSDLVVPLTTDTDYFRNRLQTVDTREILIQGTDIGAALKLASTTFDRGGESISSGAARAVILLTDGEDHEEQALSEIARLKEAGTHFFVIGVGNENGGLIPLKDAGGATTGYKRNESGQPITSRPNFTFLKELAQKAEGLYFTASTTENEAFEIRNNLKQLERGELASRKIPVFQERFQIPLLFALFFLLFDFMLPVLNRAQRHMGRKRNIGLVLIGFLGFSFSSQASEWTAYQENKKAIKSLKAENAEEASTHLEKAFELNPESPLHQYNRGTLNLQKNADQSISDLDQSAKSFRKQNQPEQAARSKLNQGIGFQGKKDLPSAAQSYLEALKDAQTAKNPELETKARKALELLIQQQNQQNKKQDQKQDQDEKKDQKQDQGENQKQDQQQEQEKKFKEHQKQAFKSEKLSKQDAERVLNELFNHEKEVHSRLKDKKQQPTKRKTQDW